MRYKSVYSLAKEKHAASKAMRFQYIVALLVVSYASLLISFVGNNHRVNNVEILPQTVC